MEHLPEYYKYLKPDKPDDAYATPDIVKNRVNTENVFYSEVGDIPIFL